MERTRQVGKHHQSGLASVAEAPSNGPWAQLVQLWLAVTHLTYFLIINLQYKLAVVDFIGQSKLAQQHSEAWEYWSSYPLGWGGSAGPKKVLEKNLRVLHKFPGK